MLSTRSGSAVAWRIARRLLRRARWQSALVVVVVALPVAVGTAVAAVGATATPTAEEKLAAYWGSADGRVESVAAVPGEPVRVEDPLLADALVGRVLPAGTDRVLDLDVSLSVGSAAGRVTEVPGRVLDLTSPLVRGIYRLDHGTPTGRAGTVVLSTALAAELAVGVGDQVLVDGRAVELVALVSDPQDLSREIAVLPPAAIASDAPLHELLDRNEVGTARWLVDLTRPPGPDEQALLATEGLGLIDRDTALRRLAGDPLVESAALGLGVGLLVESALMAAAAFTVVARAQRRNIGLLAALGASRKVRSACVLRYAILVAIIGASAGALVGELAAWTAAPVVARQTGQDWGRFDPAFTTALLLVTAAVAASVLAAWLPARESSRVPVLPLLRETAFADPAGRTRQILSGCWLMLGAAAFVLMAATGNPFLGIGAVVVTVVALAALGSDLLAATVRRPMPGSRPLARVVLLGALGAAAGLLVAIGSAGLVVASSTVAHRMAQYQPPVPAGSVLVRTTSPLSGAELGLTTRSTGAAAAAPFVRATTALGSGSDQAMVATPLLRCWSRRTRSAA